ncbi:hypothetical protein HMPREF1705_04663 [Acetomicrobium hydrogeniformans ATCC BAA-1850]|uniref:Uncharacterized protein n=1 Tax=Acetomicrobium hydrogeniformans ATCC BAA-1850 TaxID=592015 RepID=A0A0T5XB73_9BACT|nr:hypothetical protein HMPREF1705_04663 [Acetomicrobium hydrogeniformans ATCC BAA-1850]
MANKKQDSIHFFVGCCLVFLCVYPFCDRLNLSKKYDNISLQRIILN